MTTTQQDKPPVAQQEAPETTPEPDTASERYVPSTPPKALLAIGLLLAAGLALVAVLLLAGGSDKSSPNAAAPPASQPTTATPAATAKPAAAARSVGVTLKEFTLTPQPTTARAGKVTFTVRNSGAIQHEFVVIRTKKSAGNLLKGAEADEAGNVGEIGGVKPGATKTLRLNLKAGHYALICNLPGHYQAGQHADLVVK
jgi:uncharacterized cupredoxin-like copper-binding protein